MKKFYSNLSSRGKLILNIAGFCLFAFIVDLVFLKPFLSTVDSVDHAIYEEEELIKRDLQFIAQKDQIVQEFDEFSQFFSPEPQDDDVVNAEFLSTVEQLATKSNVNLVKSHPSHNQKDPTYLQYHANLDCEGTLEDVISFMYRINSTDDLLKIERFNMTPKRGAQNEVNASMSVVKLIVRADASN